MGAVGQQLLMLTLTSPVSPSSPAGTPFLSLASFQAQFTLPKEQIFLVNDSEAVKSRMGAEEIK